MKGAPFAMYYQIQKDEVLVELLSQSDAKAFNEIYRRYWLVVFRYAVCKVHTEEIAKDLCQDVFVSLWQRRNAVAVRHLEAYLIQATKFGVLNHIRNRIKDKKLSDRAVSLQTMENETENEVAFHKLMTAWEEAIARLPGKTRQVFKLSKLENYSNKEIASRMDLTEKAVEYHITKSYKMIRLLLKDFIVLLAVFFSS